MHLIARTIVVIIIGSWSASFAADQDWTEPMTICDEGLATGFECIGSFCSQINLFCDSSYKTTGTGEWTNYISEDTDDDNVATCPTGTYMAGTQCSDEYCAEVRVLCKKLWINPDDTVTYGTCRNTNSISEESDQNNPWYANPNELITGMKCTDEDSEHCDNKKLKVCEVNITPPTKGSGPVCENTYALCTSAPCIPDPSAPDDQAICNCTVQQGWNFGESSCEDRKPDTAAGTDTVLSTYSFEEAAVRKVMTCDGVPVGPWTDCLDAQCTIDSRNPGKAICTCPYGDPAEAEYVTYGGGCNTDTCTTGYWSAATVNAFKIGSLALMDKLGIAKDDPPFSFCP